MFYVAGINIMNQLYVINVALNVKFEDLKHITKPRGLENHGKLQDLSLLTIALSLETHSADANIVMRTLSYRNKFN